MTRSMTSQDAIERLVKKVITAHETIVAQKANPRPKRLRTSPTDHYYIAKYSRESVDLTAWLVDLADDPAVKVCLSAYMFRSNFIAFFRTLSRASKTIYLPASVGLHIMVMNMSFQMKTVAPSSLATTSYSSIAHCVSTTRHMIYDANKTRSIPELVPMLWYLPRRMSVHILTGTHALSGYFTSM
jgi:hypothetical protein